MSTPIDQWRASDTTALLRAPEPESHKYSRGVLGVRTGSSAYPGAAVLSVEAAWRTGIGLVRYTPPLDDEPPAFGLPHPAAAVLATRPETVFAHDTREERARCDAWLIGSGTDPLRTSFAQRESLRELLAGTAPVVVDAGALELVLARKPRSATIVTPHWGEFKALWRGAGLDEARLPSPPAHLEPRAEATATLAREIGATVLLKGSHTLVASPGGRVISYGPATPWLATAGTGDVLAGVLGAILAVNADAVRQNAEMLASIGAAATALHDCAARIAANHSIGSTAGVGPIVALDVARALPAARLSLA